MALGFCNWAPYDDADHSIGDNYLDTDYWGDKHFDHLELIPQGPASAVNEYVLRRQSNETS